MTGPCSHCGRHEHLVGPCHFGCPEWLCLRCFDAMVTLAQLAQAGERARARNDHDAQAVPLTAWDEQ